MVAPKHRKVRLKRALDSTRLPRRHARRDASRRGVDRRGARVSRRRIPEERIVVRPHGFPDVPARPRAAEAARPHRRRRRDAGRAQRRRIAHGKGLELLVQRRGAAARRARRDRRPGRRTRRRRGAARAPRSPRRRRPRALRRSLPQSEFAGVYADADVFVLPSEYENFGMVAAEAAAAGAPIVVTDRCGVAECFADRGALVVPYGEAGAPGTRCRGCSGTPSCDGGSATRRARSRPSGRGRAC